MNFKHIIMTKTQIHNFLLYFIFVLILIWLALLISLIVRILFETELLIEIVFNGWYLGSLTIVATVVHFLFKDKKKENE